MSEQEKVVRLSQRPAKRKRRGGGSGGDDIEGRLRDVEASIVAIETQLPHLATKEDLQKLKVWWLCGILAGMVAAAGIAASIASVAVRIFPPS
ncbi:MAG: hypothetical protein OXC18_02700 [Desulfurellaceae bacterium]|nr:hypothetical protein [Desulfurellaceae bacterium]